MFLLKEFIDVDKKTYLYLYSLSETYLQYKEAGRYKEKENI